MIIVVEGPDNAGKTTLVSQLAKRLHAASVKLERLPQSDEHVLTHFSALQVIGDRLQTDVITDRFPTISDFVYGPIIRGKTPLTITIAKQTWWQMAAIIYCRPPEYKLLRFNNDIAQMPGVEKNILKIRDGYDFFFTHNKPNLPRVIEYDYTQQNVGDVIKKLDTLTPPTTTTPDPKRAA